LRRTTEKKRKTILGLNQKDKEPLRVREEKYTAKIQCPSPTLKETEQGTQAIREDTYNIDERSNQGRNRLFQRGTRTNVRTLKEKEIIEEKKCNRKKGKKMTSHLKEGRNSTDRAVNFRAKKKEGEEKKEGKQSNEKRASVKRRLRTSSMQRRQRNGPGGGRKSWESIRTA